MTASTIAISGLRNGLKEASSRVQDARERLCELDAAAGDGDLGATLADGFAAVDAHLAGIEAADIGTVLRQVGITLAQTAPSTAGALLATAFMRSAVKLEGVVHLDTSGVIALLVAAADGVRERGGAQPGERTIVDAMDAAAAAAIEVAVDAGPIAVLRAAAAGADAGASATAHMEPRHGRAAWIADRARGSEDAGARAWAILLDGFASGVAAREVHGA
ncbi:MULTISPECIES: DAK2 domain-containing protein [unclassified Mycolicibacterium]|uniref:DAK2 domain-containing protein n=1 Tax=unclassified Mycolicibacterium TaxID=2636767 RepID=UPI002EDB11BA